MLFSCFRGGDNKFRTEVYCIFYLHVIKTRPGVSRGGVMLRHAVQSELMATIVNLGRIAELVVKMMKNDEIPGAC